LLIPADCFSQNEILSNNDTELWTGFSLTVPFEKKFQFESDNEIRFDNHIASYKYIQSDIGFCYKLNKNFSFSSAYRLKIFESRIDNGIHFNINSDYKFHILKLDYRLRYYVRQNGEKSASHYIRNKLTLGIDTKSFINPYIASELYYRLLYYKGDRFNTVRYFLGAELDINKDNSVEAFIMNEQEINVEVPASSMVFGLFYKLKLD
jgi:hypothetical protein